MGVMARQSRLVRLGSLLPPAVPLTRLCDCERFVALLLGIVPSLLAVFCVLGLLSSAARASMAPPQVVHLKTYASASGKYVLEVDPTELYGRGPGQYRLMVDGKEAWAKTLPLTLYDAAITNDGTTVGYAYDHSYEGFALKGGFKSGAGNLHIVVLDPKGDVRLNEINKREHSQRLHAPAEPVAKGILLHESEDRFTIRTTGEEGESWWVYQCSTGKALNRFDLRKVTSVAEAVRFVKSAKPVIGTPLSVIQWFSYNGEQQRRVVLFMLVDQEGLPVWSRELPMEDEGAQDSLRRMIEKNGLILDATKPNQFELWSVAETQRVLFSIARDQTKKEGWRIEEIDRRPYQPQENPAPPQIEQRGLTHLGSFKLDGAAPVSPTRDMQSFEFDAKGRIGAVRWDSKAGYSFVLLDPTGKLLVEVPVPAPTKGGGMKEVKAVSVAKNRWLIVGSAQELENQTWAWWFDTEKKILSAKADLEYSEASAVAATGDGGFVVLATRRSRYSSEEELYACDSAGKRLWKHVSSSDSEPGSMLSPEDVTVTSNGEVAVVDNISDTVQLFDLGGRYLRKVDLEKSWGREPNYPCGIMPDVNGGFIVYDFNGKVPFIRMRADGGVREPLHPRHRDGRVVDTRVGIRVAPGGGLWTSDGQSLLRLDQKGIVDMTVGEAPSSEKLGKIAHASGDRHGHVYAVDERTGAVHVFDPEGKKIRVCKPDPGDFTGNLRWPQVTVGDDGSVYLAEDRATESSRYVHFRPDGKRQRIRTIKLDRESSQEWYAQPGAENILVLAYQAAFLTGPKGNVLKKIDRRADRLWLDRISEAAFASDGSFVILSGSTADHSGRSAITLYTKDGIPVRTFPLPHRWAMLIGYNGSRLVLRSENTIEIYDDHGAPVQSFPRPDGEEWSMFLTRDGRELWSVDFSNRTVQRYAMP